MFQKILIANRGEIALRVICACKDLGIPTVAVYSEADRHSLHARFADEAICIGPAKSARSYLDIPSVISAAEITNATAIHPGYGFLSENARFAEVCEASGITFIGPKPEVIRTMGLKQEARRVMQEHGVPILPGSKSVVSSPEEAIELAQGIGFPVILKASAGGGGRGLRVCRNSEELPNLLSQARNEAESAFSNGDIYMEKFIEAPRHIEFQVIGDNHGRVEVLGERECSIQRRHQKLIEEAPSPAVSPALRAEISAALRFLTLLLVPIVVTLVFFGGPLVRDLLQRGRFSADDTRVVSQTLMMLCGLIVGGSLGEIAAKVFYSQQNTRTPVLVGLIGFGVGVALKFAWVRSDGVVGLASATSAFYLLNAGMLLGLITLQLGFGIFRGLLGTLFRVTIASAAAAGVGWWLVQTALPCPALWGAAGGGVALLAVLLMLRDEVAWRAVRMLIPVRPQEPSP